MPRLRNLTVYYGIKFVFIFFYSDSGSTSFKMSEWRRFAGNYRFLETVLFKDI